jgi:outer membrane protein OmpA-like peptidoglycan-associated protein
MYHSDSKMMGGLARVLVAAGALCMMLGAPISAAELSKQQIFDALSDKHTTRSLSHGERPAAPSPEDRAFVEGLRHRSNRSLSVIDRDQAEAYVKDRDRPNVDLTVNFDYDSAKITVKAVSQLTEFGMALAEPEYKDAVMFVGGHTDAKGGDSYNQLLSERRAESVKRFLVEKFHLTPANLVTAGFGRQHLKNAAEPLAAENRRVQVANLLGAEAQAR